MAFELSSTGPFSSRFSRDKHKKAVSPNFDVAVTTTEVIPASALSSVADAHLFLALPDTQSIVADYFRDGKLVNRESAGLLGLTPDELQGRAYEIEPKRFDEWIDDAKPASIRVRAKKVDTKDAKSPPKEYDVLPAYTKFILESVAEGHQERSQIVETFGDFYVFFYGERPPMYTFNGTLINTKTSNWVTDFKFFYENFFRGTKCAELGAHIVLTYGGQQVEGYILTATRSMSAQTQGGVSMSFTLVVTGMRYLGFSADFASSNGGLVVDKTLKAVLDGVVSASGAGSSEEKTSSAAEAVNSALNPTKKKKK